MKMLKYPDAIACALALARPAADFAQFREAVAPILQAVREEGDAAVQRFSQQFDGYAAINPEVTADEWAAADAALTPALRDALRQAYANIHTFHKMQVEPPLEVETMPGVHCSRRSVPIEKVGLYIPGGSAPLFSTVLMLGVPAQLAGCQEIILCTPADRAGDVHPAILAAARLCGIRRVFKIGGAQAIAALAFGTQTVPKVWKIFGPGNPWVTAAKQLATLEGVAIDLPAGPSEVAVIADAQANPSFVAADLLSQAEHGGDSQVVLFCTDKTVVQQVLSALEKQLADLPRREIAVKALQNSCAVLCKNVEQALAFSNAYAPEHLILQVESPENWADKVTNAGSVFLGAFSPESAGDYASGTNHTLPTNGFARAYAGVSLDSFLKKITFQHLTPAGLAALAPSITEMARAEGLEAHARAVDIRNAASTAPAKQEKPMLRPRPNIAALLPYTSARDDYKGQAAIFLDANENSLGSPTAENYSRYPAPPLRLKSLIAELKGATPEQIFLGNGSDEVIDLLLRAYCVPGRDNVVVLPPTYGMYAVLANIQDVEIRMAPLTLDFQGNMEAVRAVTDARSKLIFLCSPNNPSGNSLDPAFVTTLLGWFPGLVVVDEAYLDFSGQASWLQRLDEFPNLVVLQTLSKAWGLAGLRVGMAFSNPEIIRVMNKIKYPYNLSSGTMRAAENALTQGKAVFAQHLALLNQERERLTVALTALPGVERVFASDANFLLVRFADADATYQFLAEKGIVVRNRSRELHCENCLRITVGTPAENERLLEILGSGQ